MSNNINWRRLNPKNKSNPEDDLGLWHNQALEYLIKNKYRISRDFTREIKVITDLAKIVIPKVFELTGTTFSIRENDDVFIAFITAAVQVEGYSNEYLSGEGETDEFIEIFSQITTTVLKLTSSNVKTIIEELKTIDTDIQNSSLSAGDKIKIYRVNAVARYSSAYWISESQNSSSEWLEIVPSDEADGGASGQLKSGDPPDWVVADIGGAYLGALTTANPLVALGAGVGASAWDYFWDKL